MGKIREIMANAAADTKEVVAEIIGDGKLSEEAKAQRREAEQAQSDSGITKPFGNLDKST